MKDHYLVVFPRGFIGVSNSGLNREKNQKTPADKLMDLRYKRPELDDESKDVYNVNITKLYSALIDSLVTDKLAFNKSIIIEAFRSFGNRDFSEWLKLQKNSRYFTLNQQKFVLDTLRFILTGKRNMGLISWAVILHRKNVDDIESVHNNSLYDKEVSAFFNTLTDGDQPLGKNLCDIIPQWLSHRGGHEDLLLTLNIIFGKELNN